MATGLVEGTTPATSLDAGALVDALQTQMGADERRVAASMVVLGYAARLVGPGLAVLLRDGFLLDLRPERVGYSYRPDRGFQLVMTDPAGWYGPPPPTLRQQWCATVIDAHLTLVIDAVRRVVPVATGLLWGNVASGLTGALRALAHHDVPPEQCLTTGEALLAHGPLRGSGELTLHCGQLRFIRRSCCLFYRLDGGGTCGDCPLPATSTRQRR